MARTFQLYGGGPNTTPQNGLDIALAGSSVHICVLFLRFIRSLVVQGLYTGEEAVKSRKRRRRMYMRKKKGEKKIEKDDFDMFDKCYIQEY